MSVTSFNRSRPSLRPGVLSRLMAHPGLWLALGVGLALKVAVLATGSVTFDADEAVVALMARRITQGARPIFFYGQNYMGALDAYLIAPVFLIFGQTVLAVRLVQTALFLGAVGTTYGLAYRLTHNRIGAIVAGLLVALPPILVNLYTTATLGNYGETLLLGNLLLWLAWNLADGARSHPFWWLAWGLLAGLGWWGMALIVVYAAPGIALVIWRYRKAMPWGEIGLAGLGFVIGASPWLIATLQTGPAATLGDAAGAWIDDSFLGGLTAAFPSRLTTLLVFDLPALFGLRPPWSVEWVLLPVGMIVAAAYLAALYAAARRALDRETSPGERGPLATLLGGWAVLLAAFVLTPFGRDPTGRYLLPLYPLLAIVVGWWLSRAGFRPYPASSPPNRPVGLKANATSKHLHVASGFSPTLKDGILLIPAVLLTYNLWGNVRSMVNNPPGLTTQFDLISHIPHDHDEALLAFLNAHNITRGYSNYWVTYRFAFLTGERVIFSPRLPYKENMSYTYDDIRNPEYLAAVRAAGHIAYVTTNHPALDDEIRRRFDAAGVLYKEEQIGPYHVFYDLSQPITPDDLGPFGAVGGAPPD
jgi:4-amino-4-deoxy-L-arabinose transferase-like glycosyltransferase